MRIRVIPVPALALLALTACSSAYPKPLSQVEPESRVRFVSFSQAQVWPVDIELTEPAHVSLFAIGEEVEMYHPLVPVSRLEEIYGAWLGAIENEDVVAFRVRHPWPHPDSVPDPFDDAPPALDAGRHDLEQPFAPYIIQELVSPLACDYYLLIASEEAPDFDGLFDLEFTYWSRSPEEGAGRIIEALGFDPEGGGWSAVLEQGICRRGGE
jgi:hypothetical protein